jgi:Ca2+-binding EF-hand superfamily protein
MREQEGGDSMKKALMFGIGVLAFGLTALPAWSQAPVERTAGDLPGPIDSLWDLQDTGRMLFKLADQNDDGQISQKEAIDSGNLIVGGFFFRADQNGDGVLSEDEARQAKEAFLSTKPWLRYALETGRIQLQRDNATTAANTKSPTMFRGLVAVLDTNNDKKLQASELRQAVQNAVQTAFATADNNRDGQLSPGEVNAAIAGVGRQLAQAAFQQADTDNNGQVSQAEFEKAVIEPTRVVFAVMDLNHDGQLSPQEAQTARQVIITKIRALNFPEPSNSLRNQINAALGSPTQPAQQPAPPSVPR